MMFALRRSVALGCSLLFAHVSTFLRRSVVLRPGEVVDLRFQVDPYDGIRRAMALCFGFRLYWPAPPGAVAVAGGGVATGVRRCGSRGGGCGRSSRRRGRSRRGAASTALLDILLFGYTFRLVIGVVRLPFGSTFLRCLPSRRGRWRCGSRLWNRSSLRRRCGLPAALRDVILFLDPLGLVLRLVDPPFVLALLDGFLLRDGRRRNRNKSSQNRARGYKKRGFHFSLPRRAIRWCTFLRN
jgi:hypothetical protein